MSPVDMKTRSAFADGNFADDSTKAEWMKPIILGAAGAAFILIYLLFLSGPTGAALGIVGVGIELALRIGFAILALFLAMTILRSSAGPLLLAIVRLAGIFLFITATSLLMDLMGFGCVGIVINLLILCGLLIWLFEFDGMELIVVLVSMVIVNIGATFLLGTILASMG